MLMYWDKDVWALGTHRKVDEGEVVARLLAALHLPRPPQPQVHLRDVEAVVVLLQSQTNMPNRPSRETHMKMGGVESLHG
jgi:hypothetical protein